MYDFLECSDNDNTTLNAMLEYKSLLVKCYNNFVDTFTKSDDNDQIMATHGYLEVAVIGDYCDGMYAAIKPIINKMIRDHFVYLTTADTVFDSASAGVFIFNNTAINTDDAAELAKSDDIYHLRNFDSAQVSTVLLISYGTILLFESMGRFSKFIEWTKKELHISIR